MLRIGHRPGRDPRLTTHLALAARAFGAERMYLHPPDPAVEESLRKVSRNWGGTFEVVPAPNWREVVKAHDGVTVHLTMYGVALSNVVARLRRARSLLFVVGGAKVPADLYGLARHNVAVGHQPHSEVAALAVALERVRGFPRRSDHAGGALRIVPTARGKTVVAAAGRGR